MKHVIGILAAVAGLSGCTSSGLPAFGSTQRYAYPVETAALPTVRAATPTLRLVAAPAAEPATIQVRESRGAAKLPPYDETKDPYVTAVLLPPVEQGVFEEDRIGPDGKRILLAPLARIEVIDVSDNAKALAAANP